VWRGILFFMDRLEKVRSGLYAREPNAEEGEGRGHEPFFHAEKEPRVRAWEGEAFPPEPSPSPEPRRTLSLMKKFFLGSVIFFACAFAFAGFVFFRGGNVVSSEKVAIEFAAPLSATGGAPSTFEVSVRNDNTTEITSADLVLEFPDGTRSAEGADDMRRVRDELGKFASGESVIKKYTAVFLGAEGGRVSVLATLEYRVAGSNALFKKHASFEVTLGTAPLSLAVVAPRETARQGEISFEIEVKSNASAVLQDVAMEAVYPFGFVYERASPAPSYGERLWRIGDLSPGASRRVRITGALAGTEGDARVFSFRAGALAPDGRKVSTLLASAEHEVLLRKPFVALSILVDGEEGSEFIVEKNKTVRVILRWENNLPAAAADVQLIASLSGALYDGASVMPEQGGYYRAGDRTIVWDTSADPALALIAPGSQGEHSFSVNVRGPATGAYALKNASFSIAASLFARGPAGASEAGGAIETKARAEVKLFADTTISARVVRVGWPFANGGSLPPRVGTETQYTIVWSLTNAFNDVAEARVSATLPSYVRFLNQVSPASERVSYDPVSGTVVWDAGEVKAGVGIGGSPREVAFQVALAPVDSQAGTVPQLISAASVSARDRFTLREVTHTTRAPLTTRFSDSSFIAGQEVVQK
jgi:hypothetical protein